MDMRSEKGSSLLEIVIGMIIMTFLIAGLNSCLLTLINSNLKSKEIAIATSLGNAKLDGLKTTTYSNITYGSDIINSKFVRSWCVNDDGVKKRVDLTVAWPQSTCKHFIQLSTLIAKP